MSFYAISFEDSPHIIISHSINTVLIEFEKLLLVTDDTSKIIINCYEQELGLLRHCAKIFMNSKGKIKSKPPNFIDQNIVNSFAQMYKQKKSKQVIKCTSNDSEIKHLRSDIDSLKQNYERGDSEMHNDIFILKQNYKKLSDVVNSVKELNDRLCDLCAISKKETEQKIMDEINTVRFDFKLLEKKPIEQFEKKIIHLSEELQELDKKCDEDFKKKQEEIYKNKLEELKMAYPSDKENYERLKETKEDPPDFFQAKFKTFEYFENKQSLESINIEDFYCVLDEFSKKLKVDSKYSHLLEGV